MLKEEIMSATPVPSVAKEKIETLAINTIRTLAMDAVQAANSGHPGAPMGLAPTGYVLWQQFLRYDPEDPVWPNRDRFVLSNGHASMLLYSLLHLAEVKALDHDGIPTGKPAVSLENIKRFRQLDSVCAGHPESHLCSGVEVTTGPLGQGVANSVGMAIAGRWLAAHFNKPDFTLFDFDVYAICGDGCMMEGISGEAASLAGHLKLSKLCWLYDCNHISIEGSTSLAFTEDVGKRFQAYGWNVTSVEDANDLEQLKRALNVFKNTNDRPTFIIVHSHIAWGSPNKQDTAAAHGEPLGADEIKLTKRNYGWPEDAQFLIPDGVVENFRQNIGQRGSKLHQAWSALVKEYAVKYPELADELNRMEKRELVAGWDKDLPVFPADAKGLATRESSAKVLNAIAKNVPDLIGGSADLSPSTKTRLTFDKIADFQADSYAGRNLRFGVREHAMGAILNGLAVSKVRSFGSGFLIFSDYGKTPIRLAALMEIPVIYVFTHDSIGLGEDGPTHQPIEQLISLRAIPGMTIIRPGDAAEVVEAWKYIMPLRHHPVALILSRQALPTLDRTRYAAADGLQRGAYILADAPGGKPEVILLATGSEVPLCIDAYEKLKADGIAARVVSMPSWEIFEAYCQKNPAYRETVLPAAVTARVSVEEGATLGWDRYVGSKGQCIGMTTFGASAPIKDLQKKFGFTTDAVVAAVKRLVKKN